MADIEQRYVSLRHEIDRLKADLRTTVDEAERYRLHARLDDCIRESMRLIDQRLQRHFAERTGAQPAVPNAPLLERHAGDIIG